MKIPRRNFITLLGSAAAWPLAARAQRQERMRRIGVLMGYTEVDFEAQSFLNAFVQTLQKLGWNDGRNLHIDIRWAGGSVERMRGLAKELVDLQPDVILANTTPVTVALQQEARAIPIVFTIVSDPVGAGFVERLPRPGGLLTGFINVEASMGGKWLELLTDIAPGVRRAAILFNPNTAPGGGAYFLPAFEAAAHSLSVTPITAPVGDDRAIEEAIASLARESGGGLVIMTDGFLLVHRRPVIALAAKYSLPAVYPSRASTKDGGLLSYGQDTADVFERAAFYVDRILKGERPADLPVQVPTKFELVINLKTAKTLGLDVPTSILLRADEVIE